MKGAGFSLVKGAHITDFAVKNDSQPSIQPKGN